MELFVLVTILLKYVAACDCSNKRSATAESPINAIDRGVASNSSVATVAVQKYMDHLPLSRQSKQLFRRAGVHLPESSMSRWMGIVATLCLPLYDLMHELLYGGFYVHMVATNTKYLDPPVKGKAGRRTKKMSPTERLSLRKKESVPMLDAIFDWCRERVTKYDLPTDMLGKAIRYALNQESVLRVFCTDGRLPIDNNAAERILRLIAIGRKNWQFYGSVNGGKTGAVLHSILASAHRHGLNEYEYLLDVIDTLCDLPSPAAIGDLLPDRWQPKSAR